MSGLLEAVDEYVAIRRALGFKLVGIDRLLHDFVRFLEDRGEQRITIKTAVAWAVLPGKSDALHYSRLAAVRLFATYLHGADPTAEIPGVELLPLGPQRRRPFLFTDDEIARLLEATATLSTPHRRATYRTVIGCSQPQASESGKRPVLTAVTSILRSGSSWSEGSLRRSASCRLTPP